MAALPQPRARPPVAPQLVGNARRRRPDGGVPDPVLRHQVDVVERFRPVVVRLEDGHGVAVAQPCRAVDPPEKHAHTRMPDPVEIEGESLKSLELRREPEPYRGEGRNIDLL